MTTFDVSNPGISYFLGFLLTDGSIYINKLNPNKGKVSIEIKSSDAEVLSQFSKIFPFYSSITLRARKTNFSGVSSTSVWCCCRKELRDWLESLQVPFGDKSQNIRFISGVSSYDFWRGIIDGDGSLGFTKKGIPFVSLVTASEKLRDDYLEFVFSITGKGFNPNRNKRDGIYNILISKEEAVAIASVLYPPEEDYNVIKRKQQLAFDIQKWQRPLGMVKIPNKKEWDLEQDQIVLTNPTSKAMVLLNRSEASVSCRKRRLNQLKTVP